MNALTTEPVYCSLDLELSGFDPTKNEILEVGMAFFHLTESGLEVTETWSQVFRPAAPVHPKILGLTGISEQELAEAPSLSECREVLQSKIDGVTLVGHNIAVDIRFLEAFGFKVSGQSVDTLELVQFLLPTHHSYNLENLMHYFQVAHPEAHRALADAKATITVLESLLRIYAKYPVGLRTKMQEITARHPFFWIPLLAFPFQFGDPKQSEIYDKVSGDSGDAVTTDTEKILPGTVILQPLGQREVRPVVDRLLQAKPEHYVLLVPDKHTVITLWHKGLARGLFGPEDLFDQKKFEHFFKIANSPDELKFCLKILVWRATNWQTETVVDLNFSFFGGQFRSLITGGSTNEEVVSGMICTDYQTFGWLAERQSYTNRVPVLWTVDEFEQWVNNGNQGKLAWNRLLYALKTIYNPETNFGQSQHRQIITETLAAVDLYFALVNLLITRHYSGFQYVTLDLLSKNDLVFFRLQRAASHLASRFRQVAKVVSGGDYLQRMAQTLESFFENDESRVKWIEVHEQNSVFFNQPLHVASQVQRIFHHYPQPIIVASQTENAILDYLGRRLGFGQSTTVIVLPNATQSVQTEVSPRSVDDDEVLRLLEPSNLPAVVLLSSPSAVRSFYDAYYTELKHGARVFAQGYSGGSNKILRNFSIASDSILLATPEYVVRNRRAVTARMVIMGDVPQVDGKHPYIQALIGYWQEEFPDIGYLYNRRLFCQLLPLLWSTKLESMHLFAKDLESFWGPEWRKFTAAVLKPGLGVDNTGN